MKVSIIGNGLISLTLAKTLVNLGISVDVFSDKKIKKYNKIQTLGISKSNLDFFNKNIINIEKFLWNINRIEIFSENLKNEKILNFENNNKKLFSMVRNFDLYDHLLIHLNKSKLFKLKKKFNQSNITNDNYKLIFNCENNNLISKKFFHKKISKDYKSFAHITIINHKRTSNNYVASQIFTKMGPLAFLPLSQTKTSVVYSARGEKKIDLEKLIKKFNTKYEILKIDKSYSFELKSLILRNYYHKNIIAFGDLLHRLHPLAGQGFNMTIRDIKIIQKLIKFKKQNGLDLDRTICTDFEKNTKSNNFLFSSGIDFIYEFFNLESKIDNNTLSKSVKFLGKNQIVNKLFKKFADDGIVI